MINWRAYPFVRLLLPLMVGIGAALWWDIPLPGALFIHIGLLLAIVFLLFKNTNFRHRTIFGILTACTLLFVGYERTFQQHEQRQSDHFSHSLSEKNTLVGTVTAMPEKGNWIKIRLSVQQNGGNSDTAVATSGNLLLYVEQDSASAALAYGDVLCLKNVRLSPVEGPKNPDAFDYQRYLHYKNIHYQAFVRIGQWQKIASGHGNPIYELAFALRKRFLGVLQKQLPNADNYAVGAALLLGYKADLSQEVRAAYAETGAMHVLAVSGLHVGLIFLFVNFLLGLVKSDHKYWKTTKVGLLLLAIWSFALLTGASSSVMRASVMFSFFIVGKALHRNSNVYNTLAASAFCMLLWNPYLLMDVGFQLSYLAVLGIVAFQPKFYAFWSPDNRLVDFAWKLTTVSLAAQVMTFPISLLYFHQFPMYFWLSGLVVIPAAYLILGSGFLLFITEALGLFTVDWLGMILNNIIQVVNTSIFWMQKIPGGLVQGFWLSSLDVVLLYGIILAIIVAFRTHNFRWVMGGLALAVCLAGNFALKSFQHFEQKQFVVYHVSGHSVWEVLEGEQLVSVQSQGIAPSDLAFATQNHHWAMGIRNEHQFAITDLTHYQPLSIFDKKVAVVAGKLSPDAEKPVPVDYILLHGNPAFDLEQLQQRYTFQKIILDTSNDWKTAQHWRQACANSNVQVHDVRTAGAFVLEW